MGQFIKSPLYKKLEKIGLKRGYRGKKLQAYIKGRVLGRVPGNRKAKAEDKPILTGKTAKLDKVEAARIIKIDQSIIPTLKEIETKVHKDVEDEEQQLIRSKRILDLIPRIEYEAKIVGQYNVKIVELSNEMAKIRKGEMTYAERMTNTAIGNAKIRKIGMEIKKMTANVIQLIIHIEQELKYIEETMHRLKEYDKAEKVDHKKVAKWAVKVRNRIEMAREHAMVIESFPA